MRRGRLDFLQCGPGRRDGDERIDNGGQRVELFAYIVGRPREGDLQEEFVRDGGAGRVLVLVFERLAD